MPVDLPLREWPISRIMDSPRLQQKTKEEHEYEWMMKEPEPPKCVRRWIRLSGSELGRRLTLVQDANSTALFNLTLSTVPIITPGELTLPSGSIRTRTALIFRRKHYPSSHPHAPRKRLRTPLRPQCPLRY